ncbi:MAG TPA: rod shape-determining protein RodA [Saprospiraceae bacterium]|nr:rod shape-determining protein RodA [Saprospiraceae bacterium]HMX82488.1 rod shape-determining protein RodA [Saprospiraceae bacterium]HMX85582.1 rod shape-determining protein RodA [Saprospiraceae bacterium]HMZ72510.1 rod shape-determining protein RodA [Saprospiraceae bacterium]HNA94018.1 rod shape-determining protein RodA [Saprospiraceae bacterium]
MSAPKSLIKENIDWVSFSLWLSLIAIGWVMIYAVDKHKFIEAGLINFRSNTAKELLFISVSFVISLFVFFLDWKIWRVFAYPIFGLALFLLLSVLIFGVTIKGQKSWFAISGFTFQPAELAKLGTCLALSSYLSLPGVSLKRTKTFLVSIGIILTPIFFIALQPDAGSSLIFLSFLIMLYRNGMSPLFAIFIFSIGTLFVLSLKVEIHYLVAALLLIGSGILIYSFRFNKLYLSIGILALLVLTGFSLKYEFHNWVFSGIGLLILILSFIHYQNRKQQLAFFTFMACLIAVSFSLSSYYTFNNILKPHQQDRLNVWLNPDKSDPRGALYNVLQSKMAIGSGGITGKGFSNGILTKHSYIPEQKTDFIFCTVGEEHGFVGSFIVTGLFVWLLIRLIMLAERQRSAFSRNFIYGITGILFFHFFINIGMTIGLVPVIGVPLPFVSYGGSSLMSFSMMMAIVLKLDSHRNSL